MALNETCRCTYIYSTQWDIYNKHFINSTEHLVDWILILMACPKAHLSPMCALISSQSPQIFSFNGL